MTYIEAEPEPSNFRRYQERLAQVLSGELTIEGWDAMTPREQMLAVDAEYAEELDSIARVKYFPAGGKG